MPPSYDLHRFSLDHPNLSCYTEIIWDGLKITTILIHVQGGGPFKESFKKFYMYNYIISRHEITATTKLVISVRAGGKPPAGITKFVLFIFWATYLYLYIHVGERPLQSS